MIMSKLEDSRKEIDQINTELVKLLEKRFAAVKGVVEYKKENNLPVFDSAREEEVLNKISEKVSNEELKPYIKEVFRDVMDVTKVWERDELEKEGK